MTPSWSPDGREIAFSSKRGSRYEIFTKAIDDVSPEQLRPGPDGDKYVEDWTVDGALVETVMRNGLWRAPLEAGRLPSLIRETASADRWLAEVSPDGRWIAYTSSEFGAPEVYVEPVARSGARVRHKVSAQGGAEPHWRHDGRELFYLTADGYVASVAVKTGEDLDPQRAAGALPRHRSRSRQYLRLSRHTRRQVICCQYDSWIPAGAAGARRRELDLPPRAVTRLFLDPSTPGGVRKLLLRRLYVRRVHRGAWHLCR